MNVHEITAIIAQIMKARTPEECFGSVASDDALTDLFHAWSKVLHPDRPGQVKEAVVAMTRLTEMRLQARARLRDGSYGKPRPVTIKAKHVYKNVLPFAKGDLCDLYSAEYDQDGKPHRALVKVVSDDANSDLVANEASMLQRLWASTDSNRAHFVRYLPSLIETTKLRVAGRYRQSNILSFHPTRYSLDAVLAAFPHGLDPKDAAWMWRRMLEVLAWTHRNGIVHGAVVPAHFLIKPEDHSGKLIDWSYALKADGTSHIKAVVLDHAVYYPPEVHLKRPATPATDVWMAAVCMRALLYGSELVPNHSVPEAIKGLLNGCMIHNPTRRYQNAWEVYEEFDRIVRQLWGKPTFRQFRMPPTN